MTVCRRCLASLLLVLLGWNLAGCGSSGPIASLADANSAYDRGDYEQAYAFASTIASAEPSLDSQEAAYVAGLAAWELDRTDKAVKYFKKAVDGLDHEMAADAGVMLGLAYSKQEKYDLAAESLLEAAPELTGEDRARAYFYAGVAQQKLGRWAYARDNFTLARAASSDPAFRDEVDGQLAVTGYTLEIGSFSDGAAAQSAADNLTESAQELNLGEPRLLPNPTRPGQMLVHVGRFSTYDSAASFRERLGMPGAFIVPIAAEPR